MSGVLAFSSAYFWSSALQLAEEADDLAWKLWQAKVASLGVKKLHNLGFVLVFLVVLWQAKVFFGVSLGVKKLPGAPKTIKILVFWYLKTRSFGGENLGFSWFGVPQVTTWSPGVVSCVFGEVLVWTLVAFCHFW